MGNWNECGLKERKKKTENAANKISELNRETIIKAR
jgi:hypothetical protein